MTGIDELVQTEAECLRRFRAKAEEIRSQHPELPSSVAFSRAVAALPRTSEKYLYVRNRLGAAGVAALPLR
jgi:hypothetical protein